MTLLKRTKFSYKIDYSLRLQPSLKKLTLITTYFENLTVKLHVLYAKFYANKILFAV